MSRSKLEEANRELCDRAAAGDIAGVRSLLQRGTSAHGHWNPERAKEQALTFQRMMREQRASQPGPFDSLPMDLRATLEAGMDQSDEEMLERDCSAPSSTDIPLFRAAESGSAECIRTLLEAGADPFQRDNSQRTAMYYAASFDAVQALLGAGVPIEDADAYGWSPLVDAVSDGVESLPRIRALLDAGADINGTHDHGYTVFMSAVGSFERDVSLLQALVAAGANPHATSERGYNAFHAAVDVNGEANLEQSVRDVLGYLKSLGVNIEQRNHIGHTPLARALQEGTGIEARILCEIGADPNAICPKHECGDEECTRRDLPLLFHAASGIGVHADAKTEALLDAGADPLARDEHGFTPLSHVIGALCSDAHDYDGAYQCFLEALENVPEPQSSSRDRAAFIAAITPALRAAVEACADTVPVSDPSEFCMQNRAEHVNCIVTLAAYERWARHRTG